MTGYSASRLYPKIFDGGFRDLSNSPLSHDGFSEFKFAVRSHSKYSSISTFSPRKEVEDMAYAIAAPSPRTT